MDHSTPAAAPKKGAAPRELRLEQDGRSFFVPNNYSPVRTVRLRFHPTDARLIAQVSDRRLAVWDLGAAAQPVKGQRTPQVLPEPHCEQAEGWVGGFDVHPAGGWLVTGGTDRKLRRWAWKAGAPAPKPEREAAGHDGWIEAVAYSPDGKLLATGGGDLRVRLWEADTLRPLGPLAAGHKGPVRDLAWTPDGKHLVSGGEDGQVLVHGVADKKLARAVEFGNANAQQGQDPAHSGVFRLACSPDGDWLAVAGQRQFAVYGLKTGRLCAAEALSFDVAFYPAGSFLLAGFESTKLFRYDPAQLAKAALDPAGKKGKATAPAGATVATVRRNNGFGMAVHPGGGLLALATGESTVGLWKVSPR